MKRLIGIMLAAGILLSLSPGRLMAQYQIEAQVDKNEVAFGESLTLLITITQQLQSGHTARSLAPNISEIPGFDIASTRTGHSTSWINGAGVTQSQVVYELVPQEPGDKEIPSFSFKSPDGKTYSTKAIAVKVLPPEAKKDDSEADSQTDSAQSVGESSRSWFNLLLTGGMIFFVLLSVPFIFAVISSPKKDERENEIEDAEIVAEGSAPKKEPLVPAEKPRIDFAAETAKLKKESPEANFEFYRSYFDIFKLAAVQRNSALGEDMTFDEMLQKIEDINPGEGLRAAITRLGSDIEMVMYANRSPSRTFSAIEEDCRTVLRSVD